MNPRRERATARIALVALLALVAAQLAGCSRTYETSREPASLATALATAKQDGKHVVVDFFTTWCPPCKKLDRETWPAPAVTQWLDRHAILVKLDAEKHRELAARFRVEAYPTIVLLAPDGAEVERWVGFRGPDQFVREAASAIAR